MVPPCRLLALRSMRRSTASASSAAAEAPPLTRRLALVPAPARAEAPALYYILDGFILDASMNAIYPAAIIFLFAAILTLSCMTVFDCAITTIFVCCFQDKAEFGAMLPNINLLYLGCSVLALMFDTTYMERFWPQLEAWLAFMQASESGLVSTPAEELLCLAPPLAPRPARRRWLAHADGSPRPAAPAAAPRTAPHTSRRARRAPALRPRTWSRARARRARGSRQGRAARLGFVVAY